MTSLLNDTTASFPPDVLDGTTTPRSYCFHNPDAAACENVGSFYEYHIDLAANIAFLALFTASLLGYVLTLALTRRGLAFGLAFILGLVLEVLGYAGRVIGSQNPWDENGFLMQICCLTIGPAFMAAAVYLCLRRIVIAFGPENSRIPPEYYTRIFIPCDVISLILQAAGGAIASIAFHGSRSAATGTNIMIAGLAFQVFTLLCFILVSLDFAFRAHRRSRTHPLPQDPALVRMRAALPFRLFLVALALATFCILWRSAFRVAELSQGWSGPVMAKQNLFIAFEGVLILVAAVSLNVFHPAFCARELFDVGGGLTGLWCLRRRKDECGEKPNKAFDSADST
ncbi:hypothetical protein RJ55_01792 [Drechmeria coniospora]|nr:hypothetical protein RJ55_01792 [Drechmeria coniospora]